MAALLVLALAVVGATAATTTTELPQDGVLKVEQVPMMPAPFSEVRPPPPPPPVQPQDAPDPIPAMVFFLPSSHPRRPDYQEDSYMNSGPFRPLPQFDSYSQPKEDTEQTKQTAAMMYYRDHYRPVPREEDSFGYVPVAPSMAPVMEQRIVEPYQPFQQPLNRDLIINYQRPYGGYDRYPEQTDAVEPIQEEVPPPQQQQKPVDFSGNNNEEEEQQQPEVPANEVDDAETQNRPARQDVEDENQDDNQEEVVPALVFFLKKKGITNDYKLFHNKDEVGIPGKANRFRRSPGGGSGSFSQSSASSSSSSHSGDPLYFGNGGGSNSFSQSSSSSGSGTGGGGLGGSYGVEGAGYGPGNVGGGGGYNTGYGGGEDLLNRFGATDDNKPFTVQHSGTSTGKGVHSSASSSIDNTGKVTYSVQAGRH